MSATYKCNFCGEELLEKANMYSEPKSFIVKDEYDNDAPIVACITISPTSSHKDACQICWQRIRNKFVQELTESE